MPRNRFYPPAEVHTDDSGRSCTNGANLLPRGPIRRYQLVDWSALDRSYGQDSGFIAECETENGIAAITQTKARGCACDHRQWQAEI
jgi:hypothetical protein